MGKFGNCCCGDPGCCDGTDIPTITISGWTLSESSGSTETCCLHRVFTPDTAVEEVCCTELNSHSITYECVRDHYTFLNILPLVSSSTLPCPLPDDYCCPDPAVKVATITTEETFTRTGHFRAKVNIQDVRVIWGKEEIDCGGTVACRYFVKLLITIAYIGEIFVKRRVQGSVVGASTDACITYDGSLDTTWDYDEGCEDPCTFANSIADPCTAGNIGNCGEEGGTLCVERIKYFDTRPTGSITFSSSDVPGACDEPACNQVCGGYDSTSVCVAAPDEILPPLFCTNPPTVSQTTNNYTVGSQCVGSKTVLIVSPFDCCNPLTQICNTNNNCETAWSQICEEIEYPAWTKDPEECRYSSDGVEFSVPAQLTCGCTNSGTQPSFLILPDCTDTPCPACCYEPVVCAECPYCYPKYAGVGIWFSNNDITITTNCSTYVKPSDCCFSIPSITVNITYA